MPKDIIINFYTFNKHMKYCLFLIVSFSFGTAASAQTYNILAYGAIADGKTINTKAIQKAIDQCAQTGGEVIVPAGIYVTGTLYMKSNVHIVINDLATIVGSGSFDDYPNNIVQYKNFFTHFPDGSLRTNKALFFAEGVHDISITGRGTINGNGKSAAFDLGDDASSAKSKERPCTILFVDCKNVTLTDIYLTDPAYWLQNYLGCDSVHLKGLTVYNHSNFNVDGMDIDSRHVLIEDCNIDADDDGICFKSHDRNRICENIIVRNCSIASNCNAIKFGTTSIGGFKNITISHCSISKAAESPVYNWQKILKGVDEPVTDIAGIAIEMTDGGAIDSITISDIKMQDVQTPIFIVLANRGRKQVGDTVASPVGSIKNIVLNNITATGHSKMASSITAFPGYYVENVQLNNITLNDIGGGTPDDAKINLPENPAAYPENRMYGQIYPSSGLFIRHAKGIVLNNVILTIKNKDYRPVVIMDDVIDSKIIGLKADPPSGGADKIQLSNSSKIIVDQKLIN